MNLLDFASNEADRFTPKNHNFIFFLSAKKRSNPKYKTIDVCLSFKNAGKFRLLKMKLDNI